MPSQSGMQQSSNRVQILAKYLFVQVRALRRCELLAARDLETTPVCRVLLQLLQELSRLAQQVRRGCQQPPVRVRVGPVKKPSALSSTMLMPHASTVLKVSNRLFSKVFLRE